MAFQVSIEFVGLILLVVEKTRAEALLLDAAATGGPRHSAVLFVPDHKDLRGAPDFCVARPHELKPLNSFEWAGWNLTGALQFAGTKTAFSNSLTKTLDLKNVSKAAAMRKRELVPLTATVAVPSGDLSSAGVESAYKFEPDAKDDPNDPLYKTNQQLCERVKLTFDCDTDELLFYMATPGSSRTLRVVPSQVAGSIVVSNVSAGSNDASDHFGAMFDAVEWTRRPRLTRLDLSGNPDCPDRCDVCIVEKYEV